MLHAVENNNKPLVEHLLKPRKSDSKRKDDNETNDFQGETPLMIALKAGHIEVAKTILEERSEKTLKVMKGTDNDGNNVFHQAFVSPEKERATELLVSKCPSEEELKKLLMVKNIKHEGIPFHILAGQSADESVTKIVNILKSRLTDKDLMKCMEARNQRGETPLHIAAKHGHVIFVESILAISNSDRIQMGRLMNEKDKDGNTVFHLAARVNEDQQQADDDVEDAAESSVLNRLIEFLKKNKQQLDALKYFKSKNSFEMTPFDLAVSTGEVEAVEDMLKIVNNSGRKVLLEDPGHEYCLRVAAKKGHVKMFNALIHNGADLLHEEGQSRTTALDIAIEAEQREIIKAIIKAKHWKEAFRKPSTSEDQELDTPLRRLIRKMPDMAEELLDKCYYKLEHTEEGEKNHERDEVKMIYDLVEDSDKYNLVKEPIKRRLFEK